jgi:transcriptional repressor NrdR
MVCVHCGGQTAVTNSRRQQRRNQIWRRRRCSACGAVFTTIEQADHSAVWLVSINKTLQPFSRDKLLFSLHQSCRHRQHPVEDAAALADTIIRKLQSQVSDGTLDSRAIARITQVTLNRFDRVASVHYQAFHQI